VRRALYRDLAYLGRYAHVSPSEVRGMTSRERRLLTLAISDIVNAENGKS
jgi:hypothetical protein